MTARPRQSFADTYNYLNSRQRQAVDAIEGPVMVIAGPGTGKTQVLAARIANILVKTDTNPSSVLALTFTEAAAANMRQRLVEMIGSTGYYVQIDTFHAFCSHVIRNHPEHFSINRDSQSLSELERFNLVEQILTELELEAIKPLNQPLLYVKDITGALANLKNENIGPEDFRLIVDQESRRVAETRSLYQQAKSRKERPLPVKKTDLDKLENELAKNIELIEVYRRYQQLIAERGRYDYEDMISLVVRAFGSQPALLRQYQEQLHYFLVDEYQDTNAAQNRVVDVLAEYWGEGANVFVVGDPHQSIFRFQGASFENALTFIDRYPQTNIITLDRGYRCPTSVYRAAHRLIGHNTSRPRLESRPWLVEQLVTELGEPIKAVYRRQGKVEVAALPSQTLEVTFVAERIRELLAKGVGPEQIAVLFPHNADAELLQDIFDRWEVPYQLDGGQNVLTVPLIEQLLELFRAVAALKSGQQFDNLRHVLMYDWLGVEPVTVLRLARLAGRAKRSLGDILAAGYPAQAELAGELGLTEPEFAQAKVVYDQLGDWAVLDSRLTFPEWFERVVADSGFLSGLKLQPNQLELLTALHSLFRQVKALAAARRGFRLDDFLATVETMLDHRLSLAAEDLNIRRGAVHLSTVHKAKGQEWEYVFVVHAYDGKWGNRRPRQLLPLPPGVLKYTDLSDKERNEDERRLFYVALTRASRQVVVTYPQSIISTDRSKPTVPSMFVTELADLAVSIDQDQLDQLAKDQAAQLERLLTPPPLRPDDDIKTFYRQQLETFRYSVSALNAYLEDPQKFIDQYLLRTPRAIPDHLAFGTAVHAALEAHYRPVTAGKGPLSLEETLAVFAERLRRELMTDDTLHRRLELGRQALTAFVRHHQADGAKPLEVERLVGSGWSKAYLGDIPLLGKIDRIDWVGPPSQTVKVIDYKTGKISSVNKINGRALSTLSERELELPVAVRGRLKRQLLFYKLLAQLDRSFKPTVTQGEFQFVEPTAAGKIVSHRFELLDEDVAELRRLITELVAEINSLKFLEELPPVSAN
ncbi:MAG: hypothetical protein COU69_00105 [Candidatus Pacebacteria bacterium CG10_big_fil_rev_8_21_14_0_10_56_10]|nr:MAG: hypothetical protein COU69_00105 [Candidatus Pacebacteria bacterium CG10_big_fil_rev_8_21_14_0_10_56_10]